VCVYVCLCVCSLFLMHGHSFERICTQFGTWHRYTLQMVSERSCMQLAGSRLARTNWQAQRIESAVGV